MLSWDTVWHGDLCCCRALPVSFRYLSHLITDMEIGALQFRKSWLSLCWIWVYNLNSATFWTQFTFCCISTSFLQQKENWTDYLISCGSVMYVCLEDGLDQAEKKLESYHAKKMSVQFNVCFHFTDTLYFISDLVWGWSQSKRIFLFYCHLGLTCSTAEVGLSEVGGS